MTHTHRMTWYIAYSCIYCLISHVHYSHLSNSWEMHFLLVARLARLSALDMWSSYLRSSGRVCWHTVIPDVRPTCATESIGTDDRTPFGYTWAQYQQTQCRSNQPPLFSSFSFLWDSPAWWQGFARLLCLILHFINCLLIFSYTLLRRSFFFGRRISQVLRSFPFSMARSRCRRFEREVWRGEGHRRG
jgi:hypothetical protein